MIRLIVSKGIISIYRNLVLNVVHSTIAQTSIFMVISLFLSLFFLPFFSSKPPSLTLKLIHRDSPLSPLYQPNISDIEHIKRDEQISESRSLLFQQLYQGETEDSKFTKNTTIRQPLKYDDVLLTVELGIGTPTVQRTFAFDTGSHITWTQCRPCVSCFKQKEPLFDTGKSSSYSRISKKDNLVKQFKCIFAYCYYYISYNSGRYSSGIVSKESFTFKTSSGTTYKTELVFGCGMKNQGTYIAAISGILGMNKHPVSFARQLGRHIKPRFSYCLPRVTINRQASVVRFGEEAILRTKNVKSLPFLNSNEYNSHHYAVTLRGISIGGERLGLGQNAFAKGFFIDTSSPLSRIEQTDYSSVAESFERYFSKFHNVRTVRIEGPLRLCYSYTGSFNSFPNMTYHFQGADLNIRPENVVTVYRGSMHFCLAIMESKSGSSLGAIQQQNTRFVFDLDRDMLSFAQEDCSKDVAA